MVSKVGQVREITYDYDTNQISVELSLRKAWKIPDGSTITFSNELFGAAALQLNLGASKTYMEVGSVIPTQMQGGLMDKVGNDMMLCRCRFLEGGPDSGCESDSRKSIAASVTRCDAITRELAASSAQLTELMASLNKAIPEWFIMPTECSLMQMRLLATCELPQATLNTITGNLKELPLDTTLNRINATLANVQRLTAKTQQWNPFGYAS